ncbi:threonine deaminase [Saitoella coloradoensis]
MTQSNGHPVTNTANPVTDGLLASSSASQQTLHAHPHVPAHLLLPDGTPDYLRLILTSRVYDIIDETPLTHGVKLSARLGCKVMLKREDLTPVFSFKIRGAYNRMAHLDEEERWRGVVACSAGNHAQGVAYSARQLQIPATIVMPVATPAIKHSNVTRLGSKVVLHGDDFDAAKAECARLEEKHGLINIPPYDDPYVIAGQGTVAVEILRQLKLGRLEDLEAVFCCVGGGGLIAGIAAYLKRVAPWVKIVGVETYDADAMTKSLGEGKRHMLKEVGLFADGAAVKIVGEETFRLCRDFVDEMVLVSTDEICAAIKDVFEDTRSILEPAGALSVAGLKKYVAGRPPKNENKNFVAILSGANMNFDRLRFIAERAQLGEQKECFMSVTIPEKPGAFGKLHSIIEPRAVTEFSYRYSDSERAHIYISFTVTDRAQEVPEIISRLAEEGMEASDISDNEMAKSHARYLVGGRASVSHERLYRFEFPERPGALSKFLKGLKSGWNISLFHYRNHGSDVGKILAGIQVAPEEREAFETFLVGLGYPFVDETENEVYTRFMRA